MIDARNRAFAGRIKGGDDHVVGIAEAVCKIIEQIADAGIAMWFDDGDHAAGRAATGCGEDG